MSSYLAFDLGASSGKLFSGTFDAARLKIAPIHSFANGIVEMGEDMYWDFLNIFSQMTLGISKAQAMCDVVSFGIDSFNNDFSFIDRRGSLLYPVHSYRDERTRRHQEVIFARMSPEKLYAYTGNQIAPFNTLMQLAAMREEGQDFLWQAADKLLFLPDLLAYYITGEKVTEYTIAAETQMLDWTTMDWIDEVLNAFHIPRKMFAPLVMPGNQTGRATPKYLAQHGLKPFDFVSVCQHDTASAFLASPVSGHHIAIISSGTWALVGVETDAPVICQEGFAYNLANEGSLPGHHRILRNVMGSWLFQQLRADFALEGEVYDYARVQALALHSPPFAHLVDPDDPRFYLPGNMRRKIADACRELGGAAPETPGAYFRCVYESLAMKYRWILDKLERVTGRAVDTVNILGGGSLDDTASQFTANASGRLVAAGPADATSIGNILVQMLARRDIASIEQGRAVVAASCQIRFFEPREGALWDEQYKRYLHITSLQ